MAARALRDMEHIFRFQKRCQVCETRALTCEGLKCATGTVCVQTPATCDECASVGCAVDPTASVPPPEKTNVGVIAGGVVGGVLAIAILTFIVWKFCLKGKRRPITQAGWQEVDTTQQEKDQSSADFAARRSERASTHTVASMASSVLTRASNIIQIAYIPGVTDRSGHGSSNLLVPPVPPIPAMPASSSLSSPYSAASEQHYFLPDFRSSMASTSTAGRTSIAQSLAQRGSVASTMYRQNAIVSPLPAQTIVRGKAAVVSVKSATSSPIEGYETPPVPEIDPKHGVQPLRIQMPGLSSVDSVRSTAQLGPIRALNITKKKDDSTYARGTPSPLSSGNRTLVNSPEFLISPPRPLTDYSIASSDDELVHARALKMGAIDSDSDSDDEDNHVRAKQSLLRNSPSLAYADMHTIPDVRQSPFEDNFMLQPIRPPIMSQRIISYDTNSGVRTPMTPIVEESASKRGSTISDIRGQSPFSDNNRSDL